jgi:hypothetical protein
MESTFINRQFMELGCNNFPHPQDTAIAKTEQQSIRHFLAQHTTAPKANSEMS